MFITAKKLEKAGAMSEAIETFGMYFPHGGFRKKVIETAKSEGYSSYASWLESTFPTRKQRKDEGGCW